MKRMLLMFLVIGLSACSSDEEKMENVVKEESIVGKWHLTNILENGKDLYDYSCNKEYDIEEFTEDKIAVIKYSDRNYNNNCVQYTENRTYTLSDDKISIIHKKSGTIVYNATYNIKEITSTSLKLEAVTLFESGINDINPETYRYSEGEEIRIYNKLN